jgi:hypothetical protein
MWGSLTTCTMHKIAYMCSYQPKHGENARLSCNQHVTTKTQRDSSPVRTAHLFFEFLTNPSRKIIGRTPRFLYPRVGGREEKLISQSYAFRTKESGEINGFLGEWIVDVRALEWGCVGDKKNEKWRWWGRVQPATTIHTHNTHIHNSSVNQAQTNYYS